MSARRRQRVRFFATDPSDISPRERLARKAIAALRRPLLLPMAPQEQQQSYDDVMNHVVRHGLACI